MTKRVEKAKERLIIAAIKFARQPGAKRDPSGLHIAAMELDLALTEARVQAERRNRKDFPPVTAEKWVLEGKGKSEAKVEIDSTTDRRGGPTGSTTMTSSLGSKQ